MYTCYTCRPVRDDWCHAGRKREGEVKRIVRRHDAGTQCLGALEGKQDVEETSAASRVGRRAAEAHHTYQTYRTYHICHACHTYYTYHSAAAEAEPEMGVKSRLKWSAVLGRVRVVRKKATQAKGAGSWFGGRTRACRAARGVGAGLVRVWCGSIGHPLPSVGKETLALKGLFVSTCDPPGPYSLAENAWPLPTPPPCPPPSYLPRVDSQP